MIPEFVTWLDSATHEEGWSHIDGVIETVEKRGLLKIETLGFVVHETDDALTLASSWFPNDEGTPSHISQPITIPKAVIVDRTVFPRHGDGDRLRVAIARALHDLEAQATAREITRPIQRRLKDALDA